MFRVHTPQQALSGTRVALVAGHFSPEVGYQEVDLAAAFTRLGAEVLVITSTRPSRNARAIVSGKYPAGVSRIAGYKVVRLQARVTVGANVLGCKVLPLVREFAPDHVVLVGPGKLFGLDLFGSDLSPWTRIAIVQDNSDDGSSSGHVATRMLRAVAHRAIKRRAYRRVVRNADRVVLNVPETLEIITPWLKPRERARISAIALELRVGFDPETFFFDPDARRRWRTGFGVADDEILLVTCTRATPEKRLERIIETAWKLSERGSQVRYVMAGLADDNYGRALRERVRLHRDESVLLLPLLRQDEMRELFSACDLGFWPRPAITIQQAMGTGLPIVLHYKRNVSHLLADGHNGWYVKPGQTLEDAIGTAIAALDGIEVDERMAQREVTARFNHDYLSYDRIAQEIIGDRHGLRTLTPGSAENYAERQ